ncbi:MAG: outer membrane protein assembly factor BamB [Verrucomicrobiales bacterium]|jgi:outer membrane protein assembly factor BamB
MFCVGIWIMRMNVLLSAFILFTSAVRVTAEDWFRWRGPMLNGISSESGWLTKWPGDEPKISWQASVGTGFSTVVVSQERVYTMGNEADVETVFCLDANSGKVLWKHEYACPLDPKFFEGGPTSTPTIDGDAVYTLSRSGQLFCLDAVSGEIRWSKNVQEETGAAIPSWGFSGAPLVHESLLVINMGDAGVALDKKSGEVIWKSEATESGYSTPYPYKVTEDQWAVILGSAKSYVAVDIKTGKELWRYRWLTRYGVNAADPIVNGDQVFISSGYNKGSALLQLGSEEPTLVWKSKELRTQMNPSVLIKGYLYGTDGDAGNDATLKCIDWKTGEVKWSQKAVGTGGVTAADGNLIVLTSRGELIVAPASPESFQPLTRAQVLGGKCWTCPVLSNGRIYCRNADGKLVCIDARSIKPQE